MIHGWCKEDADRKMKIGTKVFKKQTDSLSKGSDCRAKYSTYETLCIPLLIKD